MHTLLKQRWPSDLHKHAQWYFLGDHEGMYVLSMHNMKMVIAKDVIRSGCNPANVISPNGFLVYDAIILYINIK